MKLWHSVLCVLGPELTWLISHFERGPTMVALRLPGRKLKTVHRQRSPRWVLNQQDW
jgi:hypothetical protein